MNTVLVSGGCGFIGSHISVELIKKGFNICIVDSLINSSENIVSKLNLIIKLENKNKKGKLFFRKGDLRNKQFLEGVFKEFKEKSLKISSVIHCAGLKSVEESVNNPLLYWDFNLNSTLSLLEVMDKYDCRNIVYSSSATIYEANGESKLTEDSPKKPINPYGHTKLTIEKVLENLYISNPEKWRIVNLRYFNPVGAHDTGLIGESPLNTPTNLFPILSKVAKKDYEKLLIFGNDWLTKDGTCIRDFIHIMDLADSHLAALEFLIENKPLIISFNIGTGKGTSVIEIVNKFIEVNHQNIPYKFVERRQGDQAYVVADNTKALKLLNWKPKKNLVDMCLDTWRWGKNLDS